MTTQFNVTPYDLEQIGRDGQGRLSVKIHGYWSADSATLYVNRKTVWSSSLSHVPYAEHPHAWEITMSHASGGRDTKEEPSDMQATLNFAAGLIALTAAGQQILSQTALLEKFYQAAQAEERAAEQAKQAAHAAAVEADAALGHEIAEMYMREARGIALAGGNAVIEAWHRGQDSFNKVVLTRTRPGAPVRVVFNGIPVPYKQAVSMLAERSHRSHVITEQAA